MIDGAVASLTVNVLEQVLLFPEASVTVIVTVVTPVPTEVPAAGDCVITNDPVAVQLSVADTLPVKFGTVAEQLAPAFAVWLEPHDDMTVQLHHLL